MKRHNVLSMSWVLNSEARLLTEQLTWGTVTWNCEFEFSWNQVLKCGKRNNRVKTSLSLDIPGCGLSIRVVLQLGFWGS